MNYVLAALAAFFLVAPQGTGIDETYPGHPPTDNAAAAINCIPPPAPAGMHWEYLVNCTLDNITNHEREWKDAQEAYKEARTALQDELADAEGELETLENIPTGGLSQADIVRLNGMIAEARGVVAGIKRSIAALDKGWIATKSRLAADFYAAIKDCCRQVENQ
jgi:hypothetical protein